MHFRLFISPITRRNRVRIFLVNVSCLYSASSSDSVSVSFSTSLKLSTSVKFFWMIIKYWLNWTSSDSKSCSVHRVRLVVFTVGNIFLHLNGHGWTFVEGKMWFVNNEGLESARCGCVEHWTSHVGLVRIDKGDISLWVSPTADCCVYMTFVAPKLCVM